MSANNLLRQQPAGSTAQKRVDAVQRALRAGAPPPPELSSLVRSGPGDPQALALAVLADLNDALERLGEELGTDTDVLARHLGALQSLDLIGQSLAALAGLINSDGEELAAPSAALSRLRARLAGA